LCKKCGCWFSIDYGRKPKSIITEHVSGKPLRKIAHDEKRSKSSVIRQYQKELEKLPNNNTLTKRYCNRFSGIIVVDGKYVNVRGYDSKIPLLWGIDYLTHDVPIFELALSESYEGWLRYFGYLKSIKYSMKIVVCDDNQNIKLAAKYMFPNVIIQTCQNHFLENIRRELLVRTEEKYRPFVDDLRYHLFSKKITREDFLQRAYKLFRKYKDNQICISYLVKINNAIDELTASTLVKHAPRTTNIIESYNSHLQARLKSIKGFQSFLSAKKWLNAYIIKRRYRKFTDCCKKFGYLNGKSSISQTLKKSAVLPLIT